MHRGHKARMMHCPVYAARLRARSATSATAAVPCLKHRKLRPDVSCCQPFSVPPPFRVPCSPSSALLPCRPIARQPPRAHCLLLALRLRPLQAPLSAEEMDARIAARFPAAPLDFLDGATWAGVRHLNKMVRRQLEADAGAIYTVDNARFIHGAGVKAAGGAA